MIPSERELLLRRYIGGEMTSAEEEEFFIQVALDRELRNELKDHRTIESAIRKDRSAQPSQHTSLRGRTAAMLLSYPAAEPAIAPVEKAPGLLARMIETLRAGSGASGKWLTLAIATTGLVIGSLLFLMMIRPDATRPTGTGEEHPTLRSTDDNRQETDPTNTPAPPSSEATAPRSEQPSGRERTGGVKQQLRVLDSDRHLSTAQSTEARRSRRAIEPQPVEEGSTRKPRKDTLDIGVDVKIGPIGK
jgi:hypothetical protein